MSSCLSGGGRTYGFDLEIVKSQSPSTTRTSHSSSPSSTLSESINSPLAISTRKPRTPRKRPNQTYNEAAALLSTVYPNIFSTKHLISQQQQHQQQSSLKYTTKVHDTFAEEFAELLPPSPAFDNTEFLINQHQIPVKPSFEFALKSPNSGEIPCQFAAADYDFPCKEDRFEEDFDAESILDEEIETGIDSIMGNLSVKNNDSIYGLTVQLPNYNDHYNWNPMGLGFNGNFDFGFGTCRGVRAFRRVDDGDWWRFPTVDVLAISPKLNKASASSSEKNNNNKKKKKKVETGEEERRASSGPCKENTNWTPATNAAGLGLKLNYEDVLNAWSDRGLPFSEEFPGIDSSDSDAIARLAQIDLFSENGGIREASVLRYREKRRSRLFSKKIRYQVRKVNADRRPRMKGRFVRRPNSSMGGQETKRK